MNNSHLVKAARIKNPITQHISGASGAYRLQNVEKQKTYNIEEWFNLCNRSEHQPPAPRGCRREDYDKSKARRTTRQSLSSKKASTRTRLLTNNALIDQVKQKTENSNDTDSLTDYNDSQFTSERCKDLEKIYWKTITYNNPLYGADMLGSLFTDDFEYWNVANLENKLNELPVKIPGVNSAYLYFGMWKSSFAWHLEDVDLYSINYIHFGAPKQWYSISQHDRDKFYSLMSEIWPEEQKTCREFLRHKTFNVSPSFLKNHGIKVNKLVHYQHEFVVTFPYGYHAGFNYGYNCAESVNFAFDYWIPIGLKAGQCKCIADSVGFNVAQMFVDDDEDETFVEDEVYDEAVQNLPSKVRSRTKQDKQKTLKKSRGTKSRELVSSIIPPTPPDSSPVHSPSFAKNSLKSHTSTRSKSWSSAPECVLCQARGSYPIISSKDNLTHAHRICALYIPETYSQIDDQDPTNVVEHLAGVTDIPVERWKFRCAYCSSGKQRKAKGPVFTGACVQCAFSNCSYSFHATCVDPAGAETVPYIDEYGNPSLKFYCPFHRNKHDNEEIGANKKVKWDIRLRVWANTLLPGDVVHISNGNLDTSKKPQLLAAVVQKNISLKGSILVNLLPDESESVEVDWKDLICPYPNLIQEEVVSDNSIPDTLNESDPSTTLNSLEVLDNTNYNKMITLEAPKIDTDMILPLSLSAVQNNNLQNFPQTIRGINITPATPPKTVSQPLNHDANNIKNTKSNALKSGMEPKNVEHSAKKQRLSISKAVSTKGETNNETLSENHQSVNSSRSHGNDITKITPLPEIPITNSQSQQAVLPSQVSTKILPSQLTPPHHTPPQMVPKAFTQVTMNSNNIGNTTQQSPYVQTINPQEMLSKTVIVSPSAQHLMPHGHDFQASNLNYGYPYESTAGYGTTTQIGRSSTGNGFVAEYYSESQPIYNQQYTIQGIQQQQPGTSASSSYFYDGTPGVTATSSNISRNGMTNTSIPIHNGYIQDDFLAVQGQDSMIPPPIPMQSHPSNAASFYTQPNMGAGSVPIGIQIPSMIAVSSSVKHIPNNQIHGPSPSDGERQHLQYRQHPTISTQTFAYPQAYSHPHHTSLTPQPQVMTPNLNTINNSNISTMSIVQHGLQIPVSSMANIIDSSPQNYGIDKNSFV